MKRGILSFLCCMLGLGLALDVCTENDFRKESVDPPEFDYPEFTVDVEMVAMETKKVTQVRVIYSSHRNIIKLTTLDAGNKLDIYLFGREGKDSEVIRIDHSGGRGRCFVSSFADEASWTVYFAGGISPKKGIAEPRQFLRLIGDSGFGSDIVLRKKEQLTKVRGLEAVVYESCQHWSNGERSSLNLLVTHLFSVPNKPWKYPRQTGNSLVPLQIKVRGSGTYNNKHITSWTHVYNFFRFVPSVDYAELELPAGVYCTGRKSYEPFPNVPDQIQFRAEVLDNKNEQTTNYMEIFDVVNNFALLKDPVRTIFREYHSGLSFDTITDTGICTIRNISTDTKLPFDYSERGNIVKELTADSFWYNTAEPYEYMGHRVVRGIPTESWVTKTKLLTDRHQDIIVEWYFAYHDKDHSLTTWNDNVQNYKEGGYRIPVLFRMWNLDATLDSSIDVYFYNVDFSRFLFGSVNIRSCFPDAPSNHLQIICPKAKEAVFNKNLEQFKWKSVKGIAKAANVQWWRIADFQVIFNALDVVIDFEILDVPPIATDIADPPTYDTLKEARANFISKVESKDFQIQVWNKSQMKMNTPVLTVMGTLQST